MLLPLFTLAAEQDLPSLGDSTSGIVSLHQEHEIGQQFLRSIRASAPTLDDAIIQDYLEHLIYRLASNSQLEDRRLDIVVIKSPTLNAFAAPGGIVGINHGLFSYGETEHEISAILSHELAHLSQRHFARQLAAGKKSGVVSMAGLLAGIVLMATTGSEAGMAAITASQGYNQSQMLKYSRDREAEADRIGIYTLAESDMDPRAMAYMFERLQRASRYSSGDRVPEFLRTHPVTKSRISDAYNQTHNYPAETYPLKLGYQLMRARVRALTTNNTGDAIAQFKSKLNTPDKTLQIANRYGLVLALTQDLEFDEARRHVRELRETYPYNIPFRIAEAEIYREAQQLDIALELLADALRLSPRNYPLSIAHAESFLAAMRPEAALDVLIPFSIDRPNDEYVWFLLAEAYGLANDIPGVHESRAEFFVLNGNFDQAIKQLGYALPLVRRNFQQSARIKQRLEDIWKMKDG
jgi:predicted Zn-dependent protease